MVKDYHSYIYANKVYNVNEMGKCLENMKLLKLTQVRKEILNNYITMICWIGFVKSYHNKLLDLQMNSNIQGMNSTYILLLYKFFPIIEKEEILPNSF